MVMTQPAQSARNTKWRFQVDTGAVGVPAWTTVNGLAELTVNAFEPTIQDDNVYEDGGWHGSVKTALTWGIEAKLIRRHQAASMTTYDPGQEKLRTLARTLGATGVAHIRVYDTQGGAEAYEGYGEVQWAPDGGDIEAVETVTVTISPKGELAVIATPVV